jgi:SAM-dependent methyltransferase
VTPSDVDPPGEPFDRDFQRYLAAKRTVDDRALDRRVLDTLRAGLAGRDRLTVLEVGAGIGTMLERLVDRELLPAETTYELLDLEPANLAAARERLPVWARERGWTVTETGADGDLLLEGEKRRVRATFTEGDALAVAPERSRDLLVGSAFLDLIDYDRLPALLDALRPGGWWYFPITFDGVTAFRPAHPHDDAVIERFHAHMDRGDGAGSTAGRQLLDGLPEGATVEAVGGSDWVVWPPYPGDEAYFLRYVLDLIRVSVAETLASEEAGPSLTRAELDDWVTARRAAVREGRLTYLTHQLDAVGRWHPE